MLIVIARDKNGNGGTLGRNIVLHGLLRSRSRDDAPPHPGYGARMRRLLIALAVLGSLGALRGAGRRPGSSSASAGRRVPELGRSQRLAARRANCGPDVIRYNVDWSSVARTRARTCGRCRATPPTTGLRPTGSSRTRPPRARASCSRSCRRRAGRTAVAHRASLRSTRATSGRSAAAVATRYSGSFVPAGATAALPRVDAYTVWNEPNRGQFLQPQGAHGWEAPKADGRPDALRAQSAIHARLARLRRSRSARSRAAAGSGRHRADRVPHALPRGGRVRGPTSSRSIPYLGSLLPVYRGDEAEAGRRDHDPQPRPPRGRRSRPPTATRVPIWLTEFAWRTADQPRHGG